MNNFSVSLVQRSFASTCLDIVKMRPFLPCEIRSECDDFHGTLVEIVFDPLKINQVNAQFEAAGYHVPEDMQVVGRTDDGSILLWGGMNSVYHLKMGEHLDDSWESNMVFEDVLHLTRPFKIKNKKVEIDEMVAQLKRVYATK
ncbi:MAG TPA: hypothetical protein VEA69_08675 [Tepidisphaeraceae bacterium]|nr:hypothetical protein [Tepidisphaeraceae bacterium]